MAWFEGRRFIQSTTWKKIVSGSESEIDEPVVSRISPGRMPTSQNELTIMVASGNRLKPDERNIGLNISFVPSRSDSDASNTSASSGFFSSGTFVQEDQDNDVGDLALEFGNLIAQNNPFTVAPQYLQRFGIYPSYPTNPTSEVKYRQARKVRRPLFLHEDESYLGAQQQRAETIISKSKSKAKAVVDRTKVKHGGIKDKRKLTISDNTPKNKNLGTGQRIVLVPTGSAGTFKVRAPYGLDPRDAKILAMKLIQRMIMMDLKTGRQVSYHLKKAKMRRLIYRSLLH